MAAAPPSEHIKDLLVADGYVFGGTGNWSVWIGKQQHNVADQTITIYDSGGLPSDPKWLLDFPSVQVRIRSDPSGYRSGYLKAIEVRDILLGKESYTASNLDRIVSITALGNVGHIGRDDQDRPEFTFNLNMIIEPSVTTSTDREPLAD